MILRPFLPHLRLQEQLEEKYRHCQISTLYTVRRTNFTHKSLHLTLSLHQSLHCHTSTLYSKSLDLTPVTVDFLLLSHLRPVPPQAIVTDVRKYKHCHYSTLYSVTTIHFTLSPQNTLHCHHRTLYSVTTAHLILSPHHTLHRHQSTLYIDTIAHFK